MRATLASAVLFSASCLSLALPLYSQSSLALPGCEPSQEVRKVLDEKLDSQVLNNMKFPERARYERSVLEDLLAKYPREILPYQRLLQEVRMNEPDAFPAIQERFVKFAADNPNDPLALTVAGIALFHKDTSESIRLLESAKAKAPDFPWPSLALADIYFGGKRADNAQAAEYIAAFFSACPASTEGKAQWILTKTRRYNPRSPLRCARNWRKRPTPNGCANTSRFGVWSFALARRPNTTRYASRSPWT